MKKTMLLFILAFTSSLVFSQVNDVFAIQTSDYTIVRGNPYTVIESLKNSGFTSQIGAPQLPTFTRNYALPPGSTVTNINFSNGSTAKIGSNLYLYPVQPPCTLNGEPCPDFVLPDQAVYNSNTPFPAATATLTNDTNTFGYHIVTVTFCPFQYLPKDRKLLLYNQINLTINYSIGNVEYQVRITESRHKITRD
ncbi:MAG: hypothetical protein K2X37_08775, partial [Chitinophagaceae bacterium]|nr:hypothetical protein [Chitinophagaceae bacterium]